MKKISFLTTILFIFIGKSNSQTLNIGQQSTIGGSLTDVPNFTINTSDGGFITVGKSSSGISGDKTETNRGGYDFWVIKYNSSLNIEWQKTIGGTSGEGANSVAELSNGDFVVCGGSASGISGDKTSSNYGLDDYWLVKLSATGSIMWDKSYGESNSDVATAMVVDSNDNIYLGGVSSSNAGTIKTENSRGSNDYWILKLDSAGNKIWDKTIGGSSGENLGGLTMDSNGDIILHGLSNSNISGEKSDNSFNNTTDIWMVKIDNNGTIIWDKTFGGDDFETYGMGVISRNGFYYAVAGSFSGISGVKTEASRGISDIWVIKVDFSGNLIWDKTLGGSGTENGINILFSSSNQLIVCGSSDSNISGDKTENSKGLHDGWVIGIDTTGTILWQKTIGGSGTDLMYSINEISTGYYLLTHSSTSNISGDKTENSDGNEDYWLAELVTDLSTNEYENYYSFNFYPNPVRDNLVIEFNSAFNNEIEIFDFTGKLVLHIKANTKNTIDISQLSNGIYFIKIENCAQKLIICH